MDTNPAGELLMGEASGTSMNPQSARMPMLMPRIGSWNLMLMGQAFLVDTQQPGPRGGDKFYSANWFMGAAEHKLGRGSFMTQIMLSLDPATITERRYPELFQTGETAFGKPIVDGQHPHNFIMGLGFSYARTLAHDTMFQIYYAPVGDPALGPVAFPHRASASELPQAALGHHWQDSSHIADNVVTVAVKHKMARLEVSGFHGMEPGEDRWKIDYGAMDSWSTRLSLFPAKNWMAQVSAGRLTRPERQEIGDVFRSTASLSYSKPMGAESWSSSVIWGRNHSTFTHRNLNSFLAETVVPVRGKNFVTGRFELVDKDELFDSGVFRIGAYTAGITRDLPPLVSGLETGIGANVTAYTLPGALKPSYGDRPFGVNVFLRLRIRPGE
ncbi:MAG: hypothetical protein ACR2I2_10780 [Bryobacteraceae bacterium]